jgi:transposase
VHLSAGNCHDSTHTQEALSEVPIEGSIVLADKAYGAKSIREYIASRGAAYCIPPKSNGREPWACDWWQYKERHLVECFFQKLKQFRRIATRFDKLARRFLGFVHLGCILIWLA